MKRRVRTQPTNPYYSNEPAVATGKMADKSMVQNASLGNKTPKMVDKHPGNISGMGNFVSKGKPHGKNSVKVPAFNTKAKQPASMSPKAHRIGGSKRGI